MCKAQGGFKRSFKVPNAFNNSTKTVFETIVGNYIVAGIVYDTLNGYYTNRLTLIGLNSQGQQQWTKKYGNVKFQYLDNIFISKWFYKQGNYLYHAGCVLDSNNYQLGVLIKFDFNGDTIWQKRYYDLSGIDVILQQVVGSVDGGFLISGLSQNSNDNSTTALIIKTDANGNELWRKKIHKSIPDTQDAKVILQDSTTKKIVTIGYQYIGNSQSWYNAPNLLILDSLGNKLHQLNYSNTECNLTDIIQTKDKKFIVIGNEYNGTLAGSVKAHKSYAFKFDINNPTTPIWSLRFDKTASGNSFYSIKDLANEDLIISGYLDSTQENNLFLNVSNRLTRINKNGVVVWNKYYNYKAINSNTVVQNVQSMLSLNKTADGGFISAIEITYNNPNKFFVVKYDSTGCDSSAYYCQTVGINELKIKSDELKIYPQPTNEFLEISFLSDDFLNNKYITVNISNALGQIVKQTILITKQTTQLNIKELLGGVYFLQVFNKEKLIATQKIIKE